MMNSDRVTHYLEQSVINQQHYQHQSVSQLNKNSQSSNINQPELRIIEQPARASHRFRYKCEGRSAGSILGCHSSNERKSYPTIEITNYHGKALVIVSCVTVKSPYRPHPHQLVGKDNCSNGICKVFISNDEMRYQFDSLGIQCSKKQDIQESLRLRESQKIDPFMTGFAHNKEFSSIDLNAVRLCFQTLIENEETKRIETPLKPVVSDIIYDKKTLVDLFIVELSPWYAPATYQQRILLTVVKDNIQVRFFEEQNGQVVWEDFGEFLPKNVYKKTSISLRVPKYRYEYISRGVECQLQLRRKSDGEVSPPKKFCYLPNLAFQSINQMIKDLYTSCRSLSIDINQTNSPLQSSDSQVQNTLKPLNDASNSLKARNLTANNLSQSLVSTNLANCLTTNLTNFPTNLINNFSIKTLQQHQQQQTTQLQISSSTIESHPGNNNTKNSQRQSYTITTPVVNTTKRKCKIETDNDQAYDLAIPSRKMSFSSKNLISSSTICLIDKHPSVNNQLINNFHSTLQSAKNVIDFNHFQQSNNPIMNYANVTSNNTTTAILNPIAITSNNSNLTNPNLS